MSYKFVTVNGRKNLRMTEIICDTEDDLVDIPAEKLEMGSTVYVIATGKIQTLASDGTWTVKGNADGITDADLADLAGAGRTTETIKGNADDITDHITDNENPHTVTLTQLGAAANADLADLAGAGRTVETIKGNADEIADHIADDENPHMVTLEQLGAAASGHTHAYVPTTRTINNKALSADISLTAADVGLGNVTNDKQMPISNGVLENYREKLVTLSGTSTTIDLSLANVFTHTLSGNTTYSITNAVSGQAHSFTLIINQTATVRTLTFPASVKWQGGEIPGTSTANKTYILTFMSVDGGTNWLGMFGGEF